MSLPEAQVSRISTCLLAGAFLIEHGLLGALSALALGLSARLGLLRRYGLLASQIAPLPDHPG